MILELDADGANSETNENNNVVVSPDPINVIGAVADLVVTSMDCPNVFPLVTDNIVWNITILNNGSAPSQPTTLYLYNSAPNAMGYANTELGTLTIPSLTPGQSTTAGITALSGTHTPDPSFAGYGEAHVLTGIKGFSFGPTPSGNLPEYSEIDGFPNIYCKKTSTDISIDILTPLTSIEPLQTLEYQLLVSNNGPNSIHNIIAPIVSLNSSNGFTDPTYSLSPQLGFIVSQITPAGGGTNNNNLFWHIPFLNSGESTLVNVSVTPQPSTGGWTGSDISIAKSADSGHNMDTDPSNNTDEISIPIDNGGNTIDLELSAVANPANPQIWSNTAVEVIVNNTGNEAATGVKIRFLQT